MSIMKLKKITIKNFKSLYDVSFDPGRVNVFIGANGSGKSSILEAIGVLSAAMTDRVNAVSLQRKGVRLSTSALYKSKFLSITKESKTVDFSLEWEMNGHDYEYLNYLTVPKDDDAWKYFAESVTCDGEAVYGRSNRSSAQLNNKIGYFSISEALSGAEYVEAAKYIHEEDEDVMFGSMFMEDMLELIDWASGFRVSKPKKTILNPGIPTTQQIIEFRDKYLKDTVSFTGYDASEGALYVLFMLSLAMHEKAPKMFAIDSFDHAMNPRLARRVVEVFCNKIIEENKTVFMTTHNPLVLDGLDLSNDDIRLFTTDRNKQGYVEVRRVQVSEKLLKLDQPLSRLWINGVLGGVPELL